jgi:ribosome-binding protein aMBF1 (putative translation factor)
MSNFEAKKATVALRIEMSLEQKGWNRKQLADALGKNPSVITKWLSGNHNFTIETIWEIESVLPVKLIDIA